MARLDLMPEPMRSHLANLPCPVFQDTPWAQGPPLARRRIALISTAGLHQRDDMPFLGISGDYRLIPGAVQAQDVVMTHLSTNFDRTGYQLDWNVAFPLDRLRELASEGIIGSVADRHYSFMGAADPVKMEPAIREIASALKQDQVDAVVLVPV